MATIKDRAAREKVVAARTRLLVSNGFFGFLAMQLKLVECTEILGQPIHTMAVDGKSLYYNPVFVHSLTDRQCEGVICHEVMHCCFQHFARRQNRDPKLWNIAGDYVINYDLRQASMELPGEPCSLQQLIEASKDPKVSKSGKKIYLYDPKFSTSNTEAVYDILMQHVTVIKIAIKGLGGKGEGDGEDPGGCGAVIDAPGSGTEQAEAQQTWETSVRMAVEIARANGIGSIPGSLKKLVEQFKRPKVSWREKTRRFIDASMTKEPSWSRLSRRSFSAGVLMPGSISDRLRHLIMINDTSGSVSYEMQRAMMGEVAGALDEGTCDKLTVLYADTKVQHVDEYVQGDLVETGKYTGGGTDFEDSFRWVKENAPDASCVIYLTDLQVNNFGEEPACPVLWATYAPDGAYDQLASHVPFGQPIHIDNTVG